MSVLMIDIGGSHVKLMNAADGEVRKFRSGPRLKPGQMARRVLRHMDGWTVERVSIGFPGLTRHARPSREPLNLGRGWLDFDYEGALGLPVRFINDAAMQALGNYERGRLFFLGLGTSTGACLIADDVVAPVEIGMLRFSRNETFCERLSDAGLERIGRKRWVAAAHDAIALLEDVFRPDLLVVGGGNAKLIRPMPPGCRMVDNSSAYRGATRLWDDGDLVAMPMETTWRLVRPPPAQATA